MAEQAPQINLTEAEIGDRQIFPLAGHAVEVRTDSLGRNRYFEVAPDGSTTNLPKSDFDRLATIQLTAYEKGAAREAHANHVPKSNHPSSFSESSRQWDAQDQQLAADQARDEYANSTERVQQIEEYNDTAELRIFGSRGRTYKDKDGNTIADADHPIPGILEQAEEAAKAALVEPDNVKHQPQPIRDRLARQRKAEARKIKQEAQKYVDEILDLQQSDGLSLSQAELVVALRRDDTQQKEAFVQKRITDLEAHGIRSAAAKRQATQEANAMYTRKDTQRLRTIKQNDLYNYDEYVAFASRGSNQPGPSRTIDNRGVVTDVMLDQAYAENEKFDDLRTLIPAAVEVVEYRQNEYARVTAEQRLSHHGRVQGNGFKAFLRGLSKSKSDAMDEKVQAEYGKYSRDLDVLAGYIEAFSDIRGKGKHYKDLASNEAATLERVLAVRGDSEVMLEAAIRTHEAELAGGSKLAKANTFLAKRWNSKSKIRKYAFVAALPFVAGAGLGLAAAAVPLTLPASIAAGLGVTYGGRKLGQAHARGVMKGEVSLRDEEAAADGIFNRVQAEIGQARTANMKNVDLAQTITEEETTQAVKANQDRRQKIGGAAAAAAGVGFGLGRIAGNLLDLGNQAQASTPNNNSHSRLGKNLAGTHNPPNPTTPPPQPPPQVYGDGFSAHHYPWDVANHYVGANDAMSTVNHGVDAVNNQVAGNPWSVHPVGNNQELFYRGRVANWEQIERFNKYMVQLLKLR